MAPGGHLTAVDSFSHQDLHLVAILGSQLVLVSTNDFPVRRFRHSDTVFEDVGRGEITGFYDWLRSSPGKLIGVAYMPLWDDEAVPQAWASLPYMSVAGHYAQVFFGPEREWQPDQCTNGEFGANWVFRSGQGSYAITFSMKGLRGADRLAAAEYASALGGRGV
jgi:hypothetical protein